MYLRYEIFYDHAEMEMKFGKTSLYDLTGHPYTVNPKDFYKYIKQKKDLSRSP